MGSCNFHMLKTVNAKKKITMEFSTETNKAQYENLIKQNSVYSLHSILYPSNTSNFFFVNRTRLTQNCFYTITSLLHNNILHKNLSQK
jgi:hypothetical protein